MFIGSGKPVIITEFRYVLFYGIGMMYETWVDFSCTT